MWCGISIGENKEESFSNRRHSIRLQSTVAVDGERYQKILQHSFFWHQFENIDFGEVRFHQTTFRSFRSQDDRKLIGLSDLAFSSYALWLPSIYSCFFNLSHLSFFYKDILNRRSMPRTKFNCWIKKSFPRRSAETSLDFMLKESHPAAFKYIRWFISNKEEQSTFLLTNHSLEWISIKNDEPF